MKQKIIGIALACILALSVLAGCGANASQSGAGSSAPSDSQADDAAWQEVEPNPNFDTRYFEDPESGLKFLLPEVWQKALYEDNCLMLTNFAHAYGFDYLSSACLEAMEKLYTDPNLPEDPADFTPEQAALQKTIEENYFPLCAIAFEKDGEKDEELRSIYSEEKVLGEKNGTTYTLFTNPGTDISSLTEEEQKEFKALQAAIPDFEKEMTLSGRKDYSGTNVSFNSQTVDGEAIDSSVFKDYKLTMVNIWATWCGPCVGEMPELQKLYENLPEGTNLISICTDGEQENELAKKILSETGAKFKTVAANDEMNQGFLAGVQSLPTTFFVDSEGNIVGDPILGVPGDDAAEAYKAAIEERLASMGA